MGVDLYCESVQDQRPFLHFWVQVKSGKQVAVAPDGETATIKVARTDLGYWRRQPLPVFLFLVPSGKRGRNPGCFYVVDFTRWMLGRGITMLPGGGWVPDDHIDMELSRFHNGSAPDREPLEGRKYKVTKRDLQRFLDNAVPKATAMLAIGSGVSPYVPVVDETSYQRVSMFCYRAPYYRHVVKQIRKTCSDTLMDLVAAEAGQRGTEEQARSAMFLSKWLEVYCGGSPLEEDRWHWEDHRALAFLALRTNRLATAKERFEEAVRIIEEDPQIKATDGYWGDNLRKLRGMIRYCEEVMGGRKRNDLRWPDALIVAASKG